MIMVCSTLGGMVIEVISVSCSLGVLVPDPLGHSGSYCSLAEHLSWWMKVSIDGCAPVCQQGKVGSCPEYLAWVRRPFVILTAASAWPLLLGFLGELVVWSKFHSLANSVNWWLANCGPLSDLMVSAIPRSENNSLSTEMVFAALHCDNGILLTNGILE